MCTVGSSGGWAAHGCDDASQRSHRTSRNASCSGWNARRSDRRGCGCAPRWGRGTETWSCPSPGRHPGRGAGCGSAPGKKCKSSSSSLSICVDNSFCQQLP